MNGIIVNDDYNSKLTGRQGVDVFKQMKDGDATVNSGILAVTLPILSAHWWIEAASESREDKRIAEFVESEVMGEEGSRTWQETLSEVLDYLWFGRMPFEIVWEFREDPMFDRPMIGLRKLARRDPATITAWKLKNGEPGVIQTTVNGSFEIPMEKMLVFVNQKRGDNWEGKSLLRSAYKHWYIKDKLYLIDAISAERQGLGVPKGKVPTGAKPADKDKLEEVLQNLRANEKGYALLEGDLDIEFMDMKAGTVKNLLPTIQHHDRAILLNILAQFLALGSTSVGSFALSNDQSRLFILCLESIADYARGIFNRHLIKKMVDYNFDVSKYPQLKYEKIGNVDHNILTTSLQRAVQTGMLTPQEEDEEYLRSVMDLPEKNKSTAVDPTMFDSILTELDDSVMNMDNALGETATPVAQKEDPENPGFDMDGQPMADAKTASWSDAQWLKAAESIEFTIKAGAPGVPLSEETKRKISEALKKHGSKGGKKKGKKSSTSQDPQIKEKTKQSKELKKQVRELNQEYRRKVLEMRAAGKKLSPEETAKMQLNLMDKKNALQSKIDKLTDEITTRKSELQADKSKTSTPDKKEKKASELGETLDRINGILDEL